MKSTIFWDVKTKLKTKLNSVAFSPQANYTERPPLVGEVSANFSANRGCRVVSAADPPGR
jgi:hypothetical protein